MKRRDPLAWSRPRRLGPPLAVWTVLAVVAGVVAARDPAYGPWYLLVGPGAYVIAQAMFRVSLNAEATPGRRRNWAFVP